MKSSKRQLSTLLIALGLFILFTGFSLLQEPWVVPGKYKKMQNESVFDGEGKMVAKQMYSKHCKSCHGKKGLGDGTKSKELDTPSGDFSTADFQGQSDGALFYKTTIGRDDMPAFDKKIPDEEDRWLLVHYMRTFKK